MENRYFIDTFNIKLNRDSVFQMLDCHEDSPVREEVEDTFEEKQGWVLEHVRPKAIIVQVEDPAFYDTYIPDQFDGLLCAIMTIGSELEEESSRCFAAGEYLEGMLLDAMADDYLFQMEDRLQDSLRGICADIGRGIAKRMEAPTDIPMEFHKPLFELSQVKSLWQMDMTSGYMFSPVKTSCIIFGLTKDAHVFRSQHDCAHCNAVNCKLRKAG